MHQDKKNIVSGTQSPSILRVVKCENLQYCRKETTCTKLCNILSSINETITMTHLDPFVDLYKINFNL